jgi:hypothetical protein
MVVVINSAGSGWLAVAAVVVVVVPPSQIKIYPFVFEIIFGFLCLNAQVCRNTIFRFFTAAEEGIKEGRKQASKQ